ncbi:50S ribosomal protein L22 [Calorimonas adulescens]|uniref:Large ribosomal subunit protein uL22 n=1 Tax=Calorimonas adulescens TaxID=2606906 RepID=A0A5D8QDN4_9THEO|nr:50S ribosomal protein L22 [Calorimonas adulescens]TZE82725.1 50S ribosomal protein L22 [Calorimonas adulescens]
MEAKAILRYARISPRKVRIVLDLIRGKQIDEAMAILKYTPKRASYMIEKLLNSAVANAENNFNMNRDKLFISKAYADQGPTLKRYLPRAHGRADVIRKRTSHITLVLEEK